jgi:hypothetical protein
MVRGLYSSEIGGQETYNIAHTSTIEKKKKKLKDDIHQIILAFSPLIIYLLDFTTVYTISMNHSSV